MSDVAYAYVHDDLTRSTCSRRLITHDLCLTSSFRRSTSYSLSRRPFRSNYITCFVLSCPGGPHRLIFSYPYPRDAVPEQGHMSIPPGKGRQIRPDTGAVWSLDELSNVEVFKPRNLSLSHRIFGQESVCNSKELHVT